jgi:PleD family two-component response regulator
VVREHVVFAHHYNLEAGAISQLGLIGRERIERGKVGGLEQGKLILIADDDSSIRGLLQTLFSGEGYRTQEAATGREVMPAVHKFRPDLFLMDVRMPCLSGMGCWST